MTTKHYTKLMMLIAIISAALNATARGQEFFRGIPLPFNNNELPNVFQPMYVDFSDDFGRDGSLNDTVVDGFRTGYVPPFELDPTGNPVPDGPLTGIAALLAGRWMPATGDDFVTSSLNGGSVGRVTDDGPAVACLPWRVYPSLGQGYLIEMSAMVAAGETVSMAYFGDVSEFGTAQGLANELGQLVLGITRGTGSQTDQVTWTIAWDDDGNRREFSGQAVASADGEELRMQLHWDDIRDSGNDLFDAWLETGSGNQQLLQGTMGTEIDVFGAGFEISGTGSRITSLLTAVPEPSSMLLGLFGLLLLGRKRRR
jgi:MYXO-CTERM domain-containing protein